MAFSPSDIPPRDAIDVSEYPEDTREAISVFSELWRIPPPKARAKPKAFWIQAARDLNEACGKVGPRVVLRALFADWNAMLHKGQAYTVTDPNSLVKMARAKAGQMQSQGAAREMPSPEEAWAHAKQAMAGPVTGLSPMIDRVVNALGGWDYLRDMEQETARIVFTGKYRELASKAAMGLLTRQMGS